MKRDTALRKLDACLFRIRRVQSSRRAMREHALLSGVRLPLTSLAILADLEREGPTRMKALAERIQSELSRTSREVHALVESGYLELEPDESDGRVVVVRLTEDGAERWNAYHDAARSVLAARLADWSVEDVARFAELFERFLESLGPDAQGPSGAR
jgi:DNA-binding MarR family transcriptional regulator